MCFVANGKKLKKEEIIMPEEPKITLNVLLKLFICTLKNENKSTKTVINFSKIFANPNLSASDVEATWNTLKIFTTKTKSLPPAFFDTKPKSFSTVIDRSKRETEIKEAYKKIRQYISRFVQKGGKNYPYDAISLSKFEKNVDIYKTMPNWYNYKIYLTQVNTICWDVLDKSKKDELIYSLMEILQRDNSINLIFYGNRFINKTELLGTYTHPKRICMEAFLLGLLYHTHKYPDSINAEELQLQPLPGKLSFKAEFLGEKNSNIFWMDYISFKNQFEKRFFTEISVNLKDNLSENAKYPYATEELQKPSKMFPVSSGQHYPLQIHTEEGSMISVQKFWEKRNQNIFLYASGGMGKTSIFLEKIKNNTEKNKTYFLLSLYQYQEEILKDFLKNTSCWILLHILLKYHYQYEYQTYETCKECENDILRQLTELLELLKHNPNGYTPEYILLLDGMNEISLEKQDALTKELEWICREWQNVRIIITGRSVPNYDIFKNFQKLELCGISDDDRNHLLSKLPNYTQIQANSELMEILKTPLFLNLYLEGRLNHNAVQVNTRGEILDHYVTNWEKEFAKRTATGLDAKTIQFITRYVLPFVAKQMTSASDFTIKRSDLLTAIKNAKELYLSNDEIYQNFIAPQNFRKKYLGNVNNHDMIDLMLKNICFLTTVPESQSHISFTHQYFRDYFAAKYILNFVETVDASYKDIKKKAELFQKFQLNQIWSIGYDAHRLIGEISGDYKNIPSPDGSFPYHKTILDELLDTAREFNKFNKDTYKQISRTITAGVICVMSLVRNGLICGVDFSGTSLLPPLFLNSKFSMNGKYPCKFRRCEVISYDISFNICCTAYGPDKKTILFGFKNGWVVLWDIQQKKVVCSYNFHTYNIYQCFYHANFSPNGKYITLFSQDIAVILETKTGNILYKHIFKKRTHFSECITAFSNNNDYYFICYPENQFFLLNLKTHQPVEIQFFENYHSDICSVMFSPDSKTLLIAGNDIVTVWNMKGNLMHKKVCNHSVNQACFLKDVKKCLICTEQNILLWELSDDSLSVLYTHNFIMDALFSPDGQYCIISTDGKKHLIHTSSGNLEFSIDDLQQVTMDHLQPAIFSSDSRYLLVVEADSDFWNNTHIFPTKEFTFMITLHDLVLRKSKTIITEKIFPISAMINKNFQYLINIEATFSPDSRHFLIVWNRNIFPDITHYSVTGEQQKINIFPYFNMFQNCDFEGTSFLDQKVRGKFRIMGAIVDNTRIFSPSDFELLDDNLDC